MILVWVQICVIWSPVTLISRETSDNMPESKEGSCMNKTFLRPGTFLSESPVRFSVANVVV